VAMIPYTYPKIGNIPQPRFYHILEGYEEHFSPDFVCTPGFSDYWERLTGHPFRWPEEKLIVSEEPEVSDVAHITPDSKDERNES